MILARKALTIHTTINVIKTQNNIELDFKLKLKIKFE